MATWFDFSGKNFKDFRPDVVSSNKIYGEHGYDDKAYGLYGNDTIYGGKGADQLYGGSGNDQLFGDEGNDKLYGEAGSDRLIGRAGNDSLYGGKGADHLYGGHGADKMWGGTDGSTDTFYFYDGQTGDKFQNKADTIYDFNDVDQIKIQVTYSYAGSDSTPNDGQYSIWKSGADWVVTYNPKGGGADYNDIIVKGGDPHGDVSFF